MKKSLFILYFLAISFFGINNASADNTAVSNSGALSNSTAIGAQSNNLVGNGVSGASVEMHSTSTGSAIPVTLPGIPGVATPTPQIFSGYNPLSNPTNINGITASEYLANKCKPTPTRNSRSSVDVRSGATGNTKIVFTAYPDYKNKRYTNNGPEKILPYFPTASGNYECLGTIMITAQKGSEDVVDINAIGSDTENYIFDNLEGYPEVYAICPTQTIGTAVGVSTSANGFSLGGAAAGLAGGNPATAVLLGLALSGSNNKGSTHPDGRLGNTCWILGKPKTPESGTHFSSDEYDQYLLKLAKEHSAQSQQNGGSGPKYEATK